MSVEGETPEGWFTTRGDWLADVSVVRNGYGTYDVVARVDGSYAELSDAERQAELHRGRIGRMLARFYRERGWSRPAPVVPEWPFGRDLAASEPEPSWWIRSSDPDAA